MGVSGLMKMAKTRGVVGNIYHLAGGLRIGIDVSVWLYQVAARSSDRSRDLALMTSRLWVARRSSTRVASRLL